MRGIVLPVQQYPADPLKTLMSMTPILNSLALVLAAHVAQFSGEHLLTSDWGGQLGPWQLQRDFRAARATVADLPAGFRIQDLRHYFASALIAGGLDIKTVQTRMRHASAKTTLDVYGHMFPDTEDATRAAIDRVIAARVPTAESLRNEREGSNDSP